MTKFHASQIEEQLKALGTWHEHSGQLQRTFQFTDFVSALEFVNLIGEYSESVQHHPDILIRWNRVTLSVNTHDAAPGGAITGKDFDLARAADKLAERLAAS